MIAAWQDAMVAEGYEHSAILAKRSILRNALEMARVDNSLEGANPVDGVSAQPDSDGGDVFAHARWL